MNTQTLTLPSSRTHTFKLCLYHHRQVKQLKLHKRFQRQLMFFEDHSGTRKATEN